MLKFNNKVPTDIKIGNKTVEKIFIRNEIVWGKITSPFYIQNTYAGQNTISIKLTKIGSLDESTYATHLLYSKDGINWNNINLSTTATNITLNQGERLYLIGDKGVLNYHNGPRFIFTTINGNQSHTLGGNLSSLLDYTDENVTIPAKTFFRLFESDTYLTSAADLILPSTVSGGCYEYLFSRCTGLTTPPTLLATTLKAGSYEYMFSGCSSLNQITTYANDVSASDCLKNWLENVAPTGTFHNLGSATYPTDSASGIPQGWTEVKS